MTQTTLDYVDDPPSAETTRTVSGGNNATIDKNENNRRKSERTTLVDEDHRDGGNGSEMEPLMETDAPLHDVVDEWAQGTSVHGVAYVTDRSTYTLWKRILWLALIIAAFGFMMWQITTLVEQYRDHEVVSDARSVVSKSIEFPAVTACNVNMFSASAQTQFNITEPQTMDEFLSLSRGLGDLIKLTKFNDRIIENLTSVWTPVMTSFGLCFTFQTSEHVVVPGYVGGLEFWANLSQSDYETTQAMAGIIIFVTQPGSPINDLQPFEVVQPGRIGAVVIEKSVHIRERQDPWSRCIGEAPSYSHAKCLDDCANDAIREHCGCRRYQDTSKPGMRFCTTEDWYTPGTDCSALVETGHQDSYGLCSCDLPPCYEESYKLSVSLLDHSAVFLEAVPEIFNISVDDFLQNEVMVLVNFQTLQYEEVTENRAMTFSQLLAAIGGSMGLFLGISVLSVFEVFGDLFALRLVPRLFGARNLYGVGSRVDSGTQ